MLHNTEIQGYTQQFDDNFNELPTPPEIKIKLKSELTEWAVNRTSDRLSEHKFSGALLVLGF